MMINSSRRRSLILSSSRFGKERKKARARVMNFEVVSRLSTEKKVVACEKKKEKKEISEENF